MNSPYFKYLAVLCLSLCLTPRDKQADGFYLAPPSFISDQITWGKNVTRSQANQLIRRLHEEDLLEPIQLWNVPKEPSTMGEYWKHLHYLSHFAEGKLLELAENPNSNEGKSFLYALQVFLDDVRPGSFDLDLLSARHRILKDLFSRLFDDLTFYIGSSRNVPGLFYGDTATEAGFPIDEEGVLVETVRYYRHGKDLATSEPLHIAPNGNLWEGGKYLGVISPRYYVIKGELDLEGGGNALYTLKHQGEYFTLVPRMSRDVKVSWQPKNFSQLVFYSGTRLGTLKSIKPAEDGGAILSFHRGDDDYIVMLSFSPSGEGMYLGEKVYWDWIIGPEDIYPQIQIDEEDNVFLYKKTTVENIESNFFVLLDPVTDTLSLLPYRTVLFHASGVLEHQLSQGGDSKKIVSRFIHGAVERKLEQFSYQGSADFIPGLYRKTHQIADLLDKVIEHEKGFSFERIVDLIEAHFKLARQAGAARQKPHPLFGKRNKTEAEDLYSTLKTILEVYGNHSGLGLTRDQIFDLFNKYFFVSRADFPGQTIYVHIEQMLERMWKDPESQIGRIHIGGVGPFEGGRYYYFSYTNFPAKSILNALGIKDFILSAYKRDNLENRARKKANRFYRKKTALLHYLFTVLEELKEVEQGLASRDNAKRLFAQLKTLFEEEEQLKEPVIRNFIRFILKQRLKRVSERAWYEKELDLIHSYIDLLEQLGVDEAMSALIQITVPDEAFTEFYLLLSGSVREERKTFLLERLIGQFKRETPKMKKGKEDWRESSLPYLVETAENHEHALLVLGYINDRIPEINKSVLLGAVRRNQDKLADWGDDGVAAVDRELLRLYGTLGLDYEDGVHFIINTSSESPEMASLAGPILGRLFAPDHFETARRQNFRDLTGLKEKAVSELSRQTILYEDLRGLEATKALNQILTPSQMLEELYGQFRLISKLNVPVSPYFYRAFSAHFEGLKKEFELKNRGEKRKKTKLLRRIVMSEKDLEMALMRRLERQSKGTDIDIDKLIDEILQQNTLMYLHGVDYADRRRHVEEVFIKTFLHKMNPYQVNAPDIKILFQHPQDFFEFVFAYVSNLNGVFRVDTLVHNISDYSVLPFLSRSKTVYVRDVFDVASGDDVVKVNNVEYYRALSVDTSKLPSYMNRPLPQMFGGSFPLRQRRRAVLTVKTLLEMELPRGSSERLTALIETAEFGLNASIKDMWLRVECLKMLVQSYLKSAGDPSVLPDSSRNALHTLFLRKGSRPKIGELDAVLVSLQHPKVYYWRKVQLLRWVEKKISKGLSLQDEEYAVDVLFDLLRDPYLSEEVIYSFVRLLRSKNNYNQPNRELAKRIKEGFHSFMTRNEILNLLRRAVPSQIKALKELASEFDLFKNYPMEKLLLALKNSDIPFSEKTFLIKLKFDWSREHLENLVDGRGGFQDENEKKNYDTFLMTWLVHTADRDTMMSILLKRFLAGGPDAPFMAGMIQSVFPIPSQKVQVASRGPLSESGETDNLLLHSQRDGEKWKVEGDVFTLYQIASKRGVPEKIVLQGNLYHELAHIYLRDLLSGKWFQIMDERFLLDEQETRLAWLEAKRILTTEYAYKEGEAAEEIAIKILELDFNRENHVLAGVANLNLLRHFKALRQPVLDLLIEFHAESRFVLREKEESRKQALIRIAQTLKQRLGPSFLIRLTAQKPPLESRCEPIASQLKYAL